MSITSALTAIGSDPYLPEVVSLVNRLDKAESSKSGTSSSSTPGIGLRYAVKPLRLYVNVVENPWMLPLLVAGIIGIPFLLGYKFGKG